ncbi:UDP-N-acetylmuramate--L-alanine ligase [Oceanibacterium hippocampi]|uniref:UDP-N-acetylmuramate--L-alanine ligase n=1 Tax=Oceanibacterium hippocampi TaxID=745714 RepID=A0A1Y5SD56_9PROT|nr:UDP-N-acetylmuramate--L-alanine ligase [Oceanibacterium hippocampi]SLN37318.1 UDP-N-acetylmuramate--L-alanine ligase [Oceanibacterium hippocampi]
MRALPLDIGLIHFVGIGGIGMSGIAEVMHNLGYQVQGSDMAANANVQRLRTLGVRVFEGHAAEQVGEAKVVVVSTAVKRDNPEVRAARERHVPVVRRAEMLAELMRLKWSIAVGGTHGKTTTTSLMAALLDRAEFDPTVINGGIINAYGTNARLGEGEWMVVEADESDGSFTKLPATIAVVTNIDPEHLDFYGDFDKVRDAFRAFVENIPFYGFAALCLDHPEVQALMGRISDRRLLAYGFSPQADVRGVDVDFAEGRSRFAAEIGDRLPGGPRRIEGLGLPMPGRHNVLNALAVVAVGVEMGFTDEVIRGALAGFEGVKRRFTRTGIVNGVTIIDDYGHHPVEIAAVLKAARQAYEGRVIAVVQPHRYSRLRDLFEDFCSCFNDADSVVVTDVYAAGEAPLEGVDRQALIDGLRAHGHRRVRGLDGPAALAGVVAEEAEAGDVVVCLGAGSISAWANALPEDLTRLTAKEASA